jgi:uncharacterized protein
MENIFKVQNNMYFIPQKHLIVEVNDIGNKMLIEKKFAWLEEKVADFKDYSYELEGRDNNKMLPIDLTILLTTKCNLRCIYCYSEAGLIPIMNVPKEPVKKYIREVVRNSILFSMSAPERRHFKATIKFTGGGEPTCAWEELVENVEYVKGLCGEEHKYVSLSLQTNGQCGDDEKIEYITKNFDSIIISCDGYGKFQDINRPRADKKSSWEFMKHFIEKIDIAKMSYTLRSTVTNNNIDNIEDICNYFFGHFNHLGFVHLEPLGPGGRGENLDMIDMNRFSEVIMALNEKFNGRVGTSVIPYKIKNGCYCDSQSGYSIVINPQGHIVSCVEMANEQLKGNEVWINKKFNNGQFVDNKQAMRMSRMGKECQNCFAKTFCFGGCPLRIPRDENGAKTTEYGINFCNLQRGMVKHALTRTIHRKCNCQ